MKRKSTTAHLVAWGLILTASVALATGDCSDYVDLSEGELPVDVSGSTTGASATFTPFVPSSVEPDCWRGYWQWACGLGPDVTYKCTAPYTGTFNFHIYASDFDADLFLYDFTCPEEPNYPDDFICGSHHGLGNRGFLKRIELAEGQEVLIVVDGFGNQSGAFALAIYDSADLDTPIGHIMETDHLPGVQAVLVKDGQIIWTGNYGMASIEENVPVSDETIFLIASVSKTITATALMQLYEDGLFALDDPVSDYLPFDVFHPLYPSVPITFRMVLSHVSSIQENPDVYSLVVCDQDAPVSLPEFSEGYYSPAGEFYDPEHNFTGFEPGTDYTYTNVGPTLAGYLVEQISGVPFAEYSRENIFEPLGIHETSFLLEDLDPTRLATGYDWYGELLPSCHYHAPFYPAAFARTSALQLTRFLAAILQGGELDGQRILEASTIELMHTVHYPEVEPNYGLLWTREHYAGREIWGHGGAWQGTCHTTMFSMPEEDIGAIVFTNRVGVYLALETIRNLLFDHALYTTDTVAVGEAALPQQARIGSCHPNPFNPRLTISFTLPRQERAEIGIFDLAGRQIEILASGEFMAGTHTLNWQGLDATGRAMPSGTYLVRLKSESSVEARKVSLIR